VAALMHEGSHADEPPSRFTEMHLEKTRETQRRAFERRQQASKAAECFRSESQLQFNLGAGGAKPMGANSKPEWRN